MMESMARSISTHSFNIALGSRGVVDGGLMRFCISTSPVGKIERIRLGGGRVVFLGSWVERDPMVFIYHNLLHRRYFGLGSLVGHKEFLLGFGYIPRTSVLEASQLAQLEGFSLNCRVL